MLKHYLRYMLFYICQLYQMSLNYLMSQLNQNYLMN